MTGKRLKYERYFLPNGLKCILYKRSDVHSINVSVVVNVGALDENIQNNGVFHVMEHLALDGTKELSTWDKVNDFVNNISASSNAYTAFDHTKYYGTFPDKYAEEAVYFLSQVVLHPLHKDSDLNKERIIILDEMAGYEDSIGQKIYRTMIENRYQKIGTSFTFDIIGTKENIKRFQQKDILINYKEAYVPENMEIYIVGNFDVDDMKKYILKYFNDDVKKIKFGKKPNRIFHKKFPEYSTFNINVGQKLDLNQYYLTISFPCYEFALTTQRKRHLLGFLSSMTASAQYQNSVLWKRLREELGIVYGVNSWSHSMYNRAFFAIETSFNPEYLETVMKEIYNGVNTILNGKISDDIFKSRQKRIIDTELMRYDNPNNILSWIVDQEDELAIHQESLSIKKYLDLIQSYKFNDVLQTAKDTFDWNKANITIVSKEDPVKVKKMAEGIWNKITND